MASDPWWHMRFASVRIDVAAFDVAGVERARTELAAALGGSYSLVGHSYGDWFAPAADVDLARRLPDANSVYLVYDVDARAVPVSGSPFSGVPGCVPVPQIACRPAVLSETAAGRDRPSQPHTVDTLRR